jgi:hypothetical protein
MVIIAGVKALLAIGVLFGAQYRPQGYCEKLSDNVLNCVRKLWGGYAECSDVRIAKRICHAMPSLPRNPPTRPPLDQGRCDSSLPFQSLG